MSVELTPSGTRGATMPRISKRLMKVLMPIANLFLRFRGMRLLSLTTVGARSGQEHAVDLSYFSDGDDAWAQAPAAAVRDTAGRLHPLETDPNRLHRIAAADDQVFHEIYRLII